MNIENILGEHMRVISGVRRGKKLLTPSGEDTRPTLDGVKESIFNMIQFDVAESNVFDAFGGSGQMAVEAISRGATSATVCEISRAASDIILKNIKACSFEEKISLQRKSAFDFIKNYRGKKFDVVFLDPPYNKEMCDKALKAIIGADILTENAVIVAETSANETLNDGYKTLRLQKCTKYGTIKVWIYRRLKNEDCSISGEL